MQYGYDIITPLDYFRKLLDEREDCLKDLTSARHAINYAITAWQIHDWIYEEKVKYPIISQFKDLKSFRDYLFKKEGNLRTIYDLADGSKHYRLKRSDKTVIGTKITSHQELSIFKKVKQSEHLQLFVRTKFGDGGLIMSFEDLMMLITIFWYNFFTDELGEDVGSIFEEGGYSLF